MVLGKMAEMDERRDERMAERNDKMLEMVFGTMSKLNDMIIEKKSE
jgi:hypothetical protein